MSKKKIINDNFREIRGGVLNCALEVENVLTESLGYIYTPSKYEFGPYRLIEDIISELAFEKKIQIFKKNVNQSIECFEVNKDIIRDLNKIKEIRNQIAHRNISYPWIFGEDDIDENNYNVITEKYNNWRDEFKFRKEGKEDFVFTISDLENYEKLCEFAIFSIQIGVGNLLSPIQD